MNLSSYIENTVSQNPLLVVGSGSSCGAGISSMGELANFLTDKICGLDGEDAEKWSEISKLLNNDVDLESALQSVGHISNFLINIIVEETWSCIALDEKSALLRIITGEDVCGFVRFFTDYSYTSNKTFNVITTNYDQIIECSAAVAGLSTWDGFDSGVFSYPTSYDDFLSRMSKLIRGKGSSFSTKEESHVRIFKPHGSLSWFKTDVGKFAKLLNVGHHDKPVLKEKKLAPIIVTPGIDKYLITHQEPYSNVFANIQNTIEETKSIIFYGFGFNDLHIQGSLITALNNEALPKIILAKKITSSFFDLIKKGEVKNYLAIEECSEGSRIYSDFVEGEEINHGVYWNLKGLLNFTWGNKNGSSVN
jgi:hypothetical protein